MNYSWIFDVNLKVNIYDQREAELLNNMPEHPYQFKNAIDQAFKVLKANGMKQQASVLMYGAVTLMVKKHEQVKS